MTAGNKNNATRIRRATDWRHSKRRNASRIYYVVAIFTALVLIAGISLDREFQVFPRITVFLFSIIGITVYMLIVFHDAVMLYGLAYRKVSALNKEDREVFNVIDEMRIASSLSVMPSIYIVNQACMNAFSSGYSDGSSIIVLTSGLIEKLNRDELQSVVAHEISHIINGDNNLLLICTAISLLLTGFSFFLLFFYIPAQVGWQNDPVILPAIIFCMLSLLLSMLLPKIAGNSHELLADAFSVKFTRSADPLVSALNKINYDSILHTDQYLAFYNSPGNQFIRNNSYFSEPMQSQPLYSMLYPTYPYPSLSVRLENVGIEGDMPVDTDAIKHLADKYLLINSLDAIDRLNKIADCNQSCLRIDLRAILASGDTDEQKLIIGRLLKSINSNSEFTSLEIIGFRQLKEELQSYFSYSAESLTVIMNISFSDENQQGSGANIVSNNQYEASFKKITTRNFTASVYASGMLSRVDINMLLSGGKSEEEQKAEIRKLVRSLQAANTGSLEIEGFYDIADEMKEYFILTAEVTYRLRTVSSIVLINADDPESSGKFSMHRAHDPYQIRFNALVQSNTIDPLIAARRMENIKKQW